MEFCPTCGSFLFTAKSPVGDEIRGGACLQQVRVNEASVSEKSAAKNGNSNSAKAQVYVTVINEED